MIVFGLYLLMALIGAQAYTQSDQISALHSLYMSTNGSAWKWRSTGTLWNFSTPVVNPCGDEWQGIRCNSSYFECAQPSTVCSVSNITLFDFGLSGPLPSSAFFNMASLTVLDLRENSLTGSIPTNIQYLTNLMFFSFKNNSFTGEVIPELVSAMNQLTVLSLGYNKLRGSPPLVDSVSNPLLRYISFSYNTFGGTLPSSIFLLPSLEEVFVEYNYFTSTLPGTISQASLLSRLAISTNSFTGTIPHNLSHVTSLQYLYLDENSLTGQLPPDLAALRRLVYLNMYDNLLSGSLPASIGNLNVTRCIAIDDNHFTGPLPSSVGEMSFLQQLSIYSNFFSGTLPASISALQYLQLILVRQNLFTGNPFPAFNRTLQRGLLSIDISLNGFTGSIEDQLFGESLQVVSLGGNCFTGSIPATMCESKTLQTVVLSGLTTGFACAEPLWSFYANSPVLATAVPGELPACLWTNLPNLTTLQASGNGLRGKIPSLSSYAQLSVLDLSFNRMSGTLPPTFQVWNFSYLFVNSNKFNGLINKLGGLPYSYSPTVPGVHLDVSVNRLSGIIPLEIEYAENVNVVDGNLFSCTWAHQPPYHDPDSADYVCGSNLLDISYYTIASALGFLIILSMILLWLRRKENIQPPSTKSDSSPSASVDSSTSSTYVESTSTSVGSVRVVILFFSQIPTWLAKLEEVLHSAKVKKSKTTDREKGDDSTDPGFADCHQLSRFVDLLRMCRRAAVVLCLWILVSCYPLFGLLKHSFGTYEVQYHWLLSGSFLSGTTPAITILAVWFAAMSILYYYFYPFPINVDHGHSTNPRKPFFSSEYPYYVNTERIRAIFMLISFFLINVIIVLAAKSGFIYFLLSSKSSFSVKVLLEVLLSAFDLIWGFGFVPFVVYRVPKSTLMSRLFLKVFLLFFNSILSPCLAIMLTDPSCFQGLFVKNDAVEASYNINFCVVYDADYNQGTDECVQSSSYITSTFYVPSFFYNYDCYSAILTNYIPIFLLSYCFLGLFAPLFTVVLISKPRSAMIRSFFPGIFWVNSHATNADSVTSLNSLDFANEHAQLASGARPTSTFITTWITKQRLLMRVDRIVASMFHHFLVMLTFGIMLPTLSMMITFVIVVYTYQWEVLIGRYLTLSPNCFDVVPVVAPVTKNKPKELDSNAVSPMHLVQGSGSTSGSVATSYDSPSLTSVGSDAVNLRGSHQLVLKIDRSGGLEMCCSSVWRAPKRCLWTMMYFSAGFFAMLLLDMGGDEVGWKHALWLSIVTLCSPLLVGLLHRGVWTVWQYLAPQPQDSVVEECEEPEEDILDSDLDLSLSMSRSQSCNSDFVDDDYSGSQRENSRDGRQESHASEVELSQAKKGRPLL